MNHGQILKSALTGLPVERAGYFTELAAYIEETPLYETNRHWMFLLLSKGCELIPPVLPKEAMAADLSDFITKHLLAVQKAAYSPDYILNNGAPIAELAMEFSGQVSEKALEAYKDGRLKSDEPEVIVYRWPYDDATAFPYADLDEDTETE